ncbi:hypothetical protein WJX74_004913 [Apatococcus lobatus]|uniref:EXPERA domain-containing protein n=1 Tax=Apatococcus lobatus TaxID=904363 RepID=A0AAW1R147_9CHLO
MASIVLPEEYQSVADHPYFPTSQQFSGYATPAVSLLFLLGTFFAGVAILLFTAWCITGHLAKTERLTLCWFTLCGIIHFVVEGAVVVCPSFYTSTDGNFLMEIWKEYAKADSRYASRDSFVISMETITAFVEGPLCFVIMYGIFKKRSWRYTLQIIVSGGQLYGDIVYYGTAYLEGFQHSRPEALYFWVYFVIINAFWIVVPIIVMAGSSRKISKAVARSMKAD